MKKGLFLKTLTNRTLSRNAETKVFARLTSHPVRGWTGKNKAFCSPGTQNGRRVNKVCVKARVQKLYDISMKIIAKIGTLFMTQTAD